jgi:hypothetical protein
LLESDLDTIESLWTINMYLMLFNEGTDNTRSQTNFWLIATPVSGFLPDKRHAVLITAYVIGATLFLPFISVFLVLKCC